MTLQNKMADVRHLINAELERLLPVPATRDARVVEAMRYSAIGTGKALRPLLVMTVGDMVNLPSETALRIGVAIEMMHTYSLIHDDLPAMDNDTLRRGKPTNHVQFDEATAILAGDALQTRAFEILTDPTAIPDAEVRSILIGELARAAGMSGMVGGQMLDLIGETSPLSLEEVERMQSLKTGALFHFSCVAPVLAARGSEKVVAALTQYAKIMGLMFQMTDDILDVEGSSALVGKTLGKDTQAHKSTFVSLLGMERTKEMVMTLKQKGMDALADFGNSADLLREILTYLIERKK